MVVMDGFPQVLLFNVIRVVISQVRCSQNCMLVEVNRLDVMLIIEVVVELRVVATVLAVMVHTMWEQVLQVLIVLDRMAH